MCIMPAAGEIKIELCIYNTNTRTERIKKHPENTRLKAGREVGPRANGPLNWTQEHKNV